MIGVYLAQSTCIFPRQYYLHRGDLVFVLAYSAAQVHVCSQMYAPNLPSVVSVLAAGGKTPIPTPVPSGAASTNTDYSSVAGLATPAARGTGSTLLHSKKLVQRSSFLALSGLSLDSRSRTGRRREQESALQLAKLYHLTGGDMGSDRHTPRPIPDADEAKRDDRGAQDDGGAFVGGDRVSALLGSGREVAVPAALARVQSARDVVLWGGGGSLSARPTQRRRSLQDVFGDAISGSAEAHTVAGLRDAKHTSEPVAIDDVVVDAVVDDGDESEESDGDANGVSGGSKTVSFHPKSGTAADRSARTIGSKSPPQPPLQRMTPEDLMERASPRLAPSVPAAAGNGAGESKSERRNSDRPSVFGTRSGRSRGAKLPELLYDFVPEMMSAEAVAATTRPSPAQFWVNEAPQPLSAATRVSVDTPSLKGHVIICGDLSNADLLVPTLRTKHCRNPPVVVLVHVEPPPTAVWNVLQWFPGIWFIRGVASKHTVLQRAGVARAKHVLVLPQHTDTSASAGANDGMPRGSAVLAAVTPSIPAAGADLPSGGSHRPRGVDDGGMQVNLPAGGAHGRAVAGTMLEESGTSGLQEDWAAATGTVIGDGDEELQDFDKLVVLLSVRTAYISATEQGAHVGALPQAEGLVPLHHLPLAAGEFDDVHDPGSGRLRNFATHDETYASVRSGSSYPTDHGTATGARPPAASLHGIPHATVVLNHSRNVRFLLSCIASSDSGKPETMPAEHKAQLHDFLDIDRTTKGHWHTAKHYADPAFAAGHMVRIASCPHTHPPQGNRPLTPAVRALNAQTAERMFVGMAAQAYYNPYLFSCACSFAMWLNAARAVLCADSTAGLQ